MALPPSPVKLLGRRHRELGVDRHPECARVNDDRIEHELSPMRRLERLACPVTVAYAERDSPEFQRQSREFADALARRGRLRRLVVATALNHFEIPETLASPEGLLGREALGLMGLEACHDSHPGR